MHSRHSWLVTHFLPVVFLASAVATTGCSSPTEKADRYYKSGMELLEKGELDKARVEFQNALQVVKTKSDAIYGLALIAERQSDWERMFGLLRRVVDLNPKHQQAHLSIGRLLLASGDLDGAMKSCTTAIELAPDDASSLALRAAILYKRGDKAAAIAQANEVLAKHPANVDAVSVLAAERMSANDTKGAIAFLDKGLASDPNNASLQLFKIQLLDSSNQIAEAEAVYAHLIETADAKQKAGYRQSLAQFYLRHKNVDKAAIELHAIARENPTNVDAKLAIVRLTKATKDDAAAVAELKAFVAAEPNNLELKFALADLYRFLKNTGAMRAVLSEIAEESELKSALKAKSLLAGSLLESGDKTGAAKLVASILADDPKQQEAMLLRAGMAIDEHRLDPAIADLRILLKESPDNPRAHLLLGRAHELAGAMELADGEYLRAFQNSKPGEPYGVGYAEFLLRRGNGSHAAQVLDEILRAAPDNLAALQLLARARIAQGDWAGAQAAADRIAKLGRKSEVADQIRGTVYANTRNFDASIKAFKSAYAAAPDSRALVALASSYVAAGKKAEAKEFVDSVLKSDPKNAPALQLKAQLQLLDNDIAGAEKSLEQAIAIEPENHEGYRNLAILHARGKRYDDAKAVIERGLKVLPDQLDLQVTLASLHEASGKSDAAIAVYERLVEKHPNADVLINNLASLLSEHRDDKESIRHAYELAKKLERSDVPEMRDTWAWASYRAGNYPQAATALEQVVRQMPNAAIFRYHLAMVYRAQGNNKQARTELEKAIKLAETAPFPQLEAAKAALATL